MSNFDETMLNKLAWLEREVERLRVGEKPSKDGWIPATGTWTYASATTITIPSGAAALYKVGQGIKLTQTTVKHFYVVGVADTVLTITGGSDYTLTNATISAVSYTNTPGTAIGFPVWFTYTCTITFTAGTAPSGTLYDEDTLFMMAGNAVTVNVTKVGYSSPGTNVTKASLTLPVPTTTFQTGFCAIQNNDTPNLTTCILVDQRADLYCVSVNATHVFFFATYKVA